MDSLVGPLSEGKAVLQLAVIVGALATAGIWALATVLGGPLPSSPGPFVFVSAFVLGIVFVFLGHVAWHYRRSRA